MKFQFTLVENAKDSLAHAVDHLVQEKPSTGDRLKGLADQYYKLRMTRSFVLQDEAKKLKDNLEEMKLALIKAVDEARKQEEDKARLEKKEGTDDRRDRRDHRIALGSLIATVVIGLLSLFIGWRSNSKNEHRFDEKLRSEVTNLGIPDLRDRLKK